MKDLGRDYNTSDSEGLALMLIKPHLKDAIIMSGSVVEKRKTSRLSVNQNYQLTINGVVYIGSIGNISLSGAYLSTCTPELPHSIVSQKGTLTIKFDDEWRSLNCEIIYTGKNDTLFPSGVGVVFCENKPTSTITCNLVVNHLLLH